MRIQNPLALLERRLQASKREKLEKAVKITAGTAAAIWMGLRLKRELYGPGGSKMSRYDPDVDKVWTDSGKRGKG
ncbi:MAG TPA: hypothetical protein VHM24_12475 [Gemmatimonadaceae bacterium]|nr:hypothetical protein [Gemmatimonadaceae bacterium]